METCPEVVMGNDGGRIQFSDRDPVAVIQLSIFELGDKSIIKEYAAAMQEKNYPFKNISNFRN